MYNKINWQLSIVFVFCIPWIYIVAKYFDFYNTPFLLWYSFEWFLFHLSWYALICVMLIRPIWEIVANFYGAKSALMLKKLLIFRQSFWILSAIIICTILVGKFFLNSWYIPFYFSVDNWSLDIPLIARISEISALILLLTSNTFSKKILKKNWKKVQKLSYVFFLSWWIIAGQYESFYYYSMWIVWAIYIINIFIKKSSLWK